MSTSTNLHGVAGCTVEHHVDHQPTPFATVTAYDDKANEIALFFADLDAAEAWLLEALGQVTDAKIDAAKKQWPSVHCDDCQRQANTDTLANNPLARIGEPIDLTAVDL